MRYKIRILDITSEHHALIVANALRLLRTDMGVACWRDGDVKFLQHKHDMENTTKMSEEDGRGQTGERKPRCNIEILCSDCHGR